jgi:Flp pilus assembly pilin Flp
MDWLMRKLLQDKRGTTATEYAFVAVMISIACIGGYAALGEEVKSKWDSAWERSRAAVGY